MKLSPRDAAGYFARPDPARTGLLIYGGDAMRVALRRQEVIAALIGPKGDEEMRLARMTGAELRKDPAMLLDAVKAQSFFPGPLVAFVEEATDAVAATVTAALEDWDRWRCAGDRDRRTAQGQFETAQAVRRAQECLCCGPL